MFYFKFRFENMYLGSTTKARDFRDDSTEFLLFVSISYDYKLLSFFAKSLKKPFEDYILKGDDLIQTWDRHI